MEVLPSIKPFKIATKEAKPTLAAPLTCSTRSSHKECHQQTPTEANSLTGQSLSLPTVTAASIRATEIHQSLTKTLKSIFEGQILPELT